MPLKKPRPSPISISSSRSGASSGASGSGGSSNREVMTVSELTRSAKMLLEGEFPSVFIEGEISNFSAPASGHWYFTLKDSKSQLRSAMFKGRNQRLRFVPRNGMQVIVRGKISLYEGRGDFQMIAEHMEEAGDGALRRAFEQLKARLDAEGLFDQNTKQPIAELPEHLAIITSPTGAAIKDVLHVLNRRFPALKVTIIPVAVQGEDAAPQIVEALDLANRYAAEPFDTILLTRGGGSLEDLWAFNTEPVARAIYDSAIPVVSAVGHEIDITIADYVADLRAPTPSAAAEVLSPDQQSWQQQLSLIAQQLNQMMAGKHGQLSSQLRHLSARLRHPGERLNQLHQRFDELEGRLHRSIAMGMSKTDIPMLERRLTLAIKQQIVNKDQQLFRTQSRIVNPSQKLDRIGNQLEKLSNRSKQAINVKHLSARARLENVASKLNTLSPLNTLERGYSIVTKGESFTGKVVTDGSQLKIGDIVTARLSKGHASAKITQVIESDEPVDPQTSLFPKDA